MVKANLTTLTEVPAGWGLQAVVDASVVYVADEERPGPGTSSARAHELLAEAAEAGALLHPRSGLRALRAHDRLLHERLTELAERVVQARARKPKKLEQKVSERRHVGK